MFKMKDIAGKRFGKLTAIKPVGKNKQGKYLWLCECECGREKVVCQSELASGNTISCGCVITNTSHSMSRTKLYKTWTQMKMRCYNQNHVSYYNYGGRGIKVCDEWSGEHSFPSFYNWAINAGYKDGLSLDRIDNGKDYSPENCRWVARPFQERNKRNTFYAEYNGSKIPIAELCAELSIPTQVVYHRIIRGWEFESAVTTPIKYRSKEQANAYNSSVSIQEMKKAIKKTMNVQKV